MCPLILLHFSAPPFLLSDLPPEQGHFGFSVFPQPLISSPVSSKVYYICPQLNINVSSICAKPLIMCFEGIFSVCFCVCIRISNNYFLVAVFMRTKYSNNERGRETQKIIFPLTLFLVFFLLKCESGLQDMLNTG